MEKSLVISLVRVLLPVGGISFSIAFYLAVSDMGRSERIFPILLIISLVLISLVVILGEFRALRAVWGESDATDRLDVDGLRSSGWHRSLLIAFGCVVYYVVINRFGLLFTAFLVYVTCAATVNPDKFSWKSWIRCLVGAAVAAVVLDTVFRGWLGLPLPASALGWGTVTWTSF